MTSATKLVYAVLAKTGLESPERYEPKRARDRLLRRLASRGVPANLTEEEKQLVSGLGFGVDPAPVKELSRVTKTAKPARGAKAAKAKVAAVESEDAGDTKKTEGAPRNVKDGNGADKKRVNGAQIFRDLFTKHKTLGRDEVFKRCAALGVAEDTVRAYLSWAKGTSKLADRFGFHLAEKKDANGNYVLTRVK